MNLQDLCERIVRDAIPATDSGATCFVPRYQIDQLREALVATQPPAEAQAQDGGEVAEVRETQCSCHPQTCCCGDYMLWVHGVGLTTGYRDNMQTIADAINAKAAPPSAPVGVEEMQRRLDREESDHGRTIDQARSTPTEAADREEH